MLKSIFIGLVSSLILGCGGSSSSSDNTDDSDASDGYTKSLFEVWTATDDSIEMTLEDGNITGGEFTGYFALSTGETCECTTQMTGSYLEGDFELKDCTYIGGGTGDPPCSSYNADYTYLREGNALFLCDLTDSCTEFE